MTLVTGKKCTWEQLKIGEIFVWFADETNYIVYKNSEDSVRILQVSDSDFLFSSFVGGVVKGVIVKNKKGVVILDIPIVNFLNRLYKLPKSVQRLWKEE